MKIIFLFFRSGSENSDNEHADDDSSASSDAKDDMMTSATLNVLSTYQPLNNSNWSINNAAAAEKPMQIDNNTKLIDISSSDLKNEQQQQHEFFADFANFNGRVASSTANEDFSDLF